jgi:hypothetical protein
LKGLESLDWQAGHSHCERRRLCGLIETQREFSIEESLSRRNMSLADEFLISYMGRTSYAFGEDISMPRYVRLQLRSS